MINFHHVFFSYIFSGNQIKHILFLTFRHLSLSSIILYILTFKEIFFYFSQYNDQIYKVTGNALEE